MTNELTPETRQQIPDEDRPPLPPGHTFIYYEDDVYPYCECGKWLEPGHYEFEDHLRFVHNEGKAEHQL